MKIEFAKTIALAEILKKIGLPHTNKKKPFQLNLAETNAIPVIVVINLRNNNWNFPNEEGGKNSIEFVQLYLQISGLHCGEPDALRWLQNMFHGPFAIKPIVSPQDTVQDLRYKLKSIKPLSNALIRYLEREGIAAEIAQTYLKQLRIKSPASNLVITAAGMNNEENGYEYISPHYRGCVRRQSITFIRGEQPGHGTIHIFKNALDFLSIMTQRGGKLFDGDAIILHSYSQLKIAAGYMHKYGYRIAYTYMDNSCFGNEARLELHSFFKGEEMLYHKPMNAKYKGYADVHSWHSVLGFKGVL